MAELSITIPGSVVTAYMEAVNSNLGPDDQLTKPQILKKIKGVLKDEFRSTIQDYREAQRSPIDMSDVEGIPTD